MIQRVPSALRLPALLALAAAGLAVLPAGAAAQFTVSPGSVSLVATDTVANEVVYVRNESAGDLQFRFYLGDFEQAESGDYEFLELGAHPQSCAKRLAVFPDGAVLRPGQTEAVRLAMSPDLASCWGMLFVETVTDDGGPVRIAKRIAVKVFATPAVDAPEGEITRVDVARQSGALAAEFEFKNTGLLPVNGAGRLEIRSLDGKTVDQVEIERFSVLPGHRRRVVVPIARALPAGRYLAVPVVDFGAEYMAGGQAAFSVP